MNTDLLKRQFIEAQVHAEALEHTVQQFEAFKASLQSEKINQIVQELDSDQHNFTLLEKVIAPLGDSLSDTARQLHEIENLLLRLDFEYLEE